MSTIFDFSRNINKLYSEKKYAEALVFFKNNKECFTHAEIKSNSYLISDIINCLRHTKAYLPAYKFVEYYEVIIDETSPERILTAYSWLLYNHFKAENDITELEEADHWQENREVVNQNESIDVKRVELIQKIEFVVVLLLKNESAYSVSVLEFLFKAVLKGEVKRQKPDWYFIVKFCKRFKPENLSLQCQTIQVIRKGQSKDMEIASVREDWYAYLSKALYQTKQYEQCMALSKSAFEEIAKFHYSNDLWFTRRMALCLKQMGKTVEAIKSLEVLLGKKREWFIIGELSTFYFEIGEVTKALKYAREAMVAFGPLNFKVELIETFGDMLRKNGQSDLAHKHYLFAKFLRDDEKWFVDKILLDKIESSSIEKFTQIPSRSVLENELKDYWGRDSLMENSMISKRNKISGSIIKLLPVKEAGVDGFIKSDVGDVVYVFVPKEHPLFKDVKVGLRLEFEVVASQKEKGGKAVKFNRI